MTRTNVRKKTIYIAARFAFKSEVERIARLFEKRGYTLISDWTKHKTIKPYENNPELAKQYAVEDIAAARNCDVFVLISDEAGTGMYVELGAAISSALEIGKPKIYVIGEHLSRAMFYYHHLVERRRMIEEVLKEI